MMGVRFAATTIPSAAGDLDNRPPASVVAQGVVLVSLALSVALLLAIGRELGGPRAGISAAIFYLLTPVVVDYSFVVVPLFLALMFMLLATYCHQRAARVGIMFALSQ